MDRKLLFLITEDKWFLTHRLTLANLAKSEGYRIVVVTKVTKYKDEIRAHGYPVIPLKASRGGTNPLRELMTLWQLYKIYKSEKPDIAHHIGVKNIIYGTISARLNKTPYIVNAFAGLGLIFSNPEEKSRFLKGSIISVLKLLLRKSNIAIIFQNPDDQRQLVDLGIVKQNQINLIRSSGVNLDRFIVTPEPDKLPVRLVFAGRLLWPKGVGILVEAARILKTRKCQVEIQLVGEPDPENSSSIQEDQLKEWQSEGLVDWIGYREDMSAIWNQCHIAILPSFYGEGVPKVLLEAAACGRPLIATDSTGCREIAINDYNAITVPPKDSQSLANAIVQLSEDKQLRRRLGRNSRTLVEEHFSDKFVAEQTIALYEKLR